MIKTIAALFVEEFGIYSDEAKKTKRNQQSRSRYSAARSQGLRRTADGWV